MNITTTTTPNPSAIVTLWAESTTSPTSARYTDLVRDKSHALTNRTAPSPLGFFAWTSVPVAQITPQHVAEYTDYLTQSGLAPATIYARISRISSFYNWLCRDSRFSNILTNPVPLARPKAPNPYANKKAKALSDEQARALLGYVRSRANRKRAKIGTKRDYAMLKLFFATGKRRSEIIDLTWDAILWEHDRVVITTVEKGSLYRACEVRDRETIEALRAYLTAAGRFNTTQAPDSPLWMRHDHEAEGQQPVSDAAIAKAFKRYAERVGITDFHLHQTRHTVARIVGEQTGSASAVQEVLGHQSLQTTRVYLDRIAIKRDSSKLIAEALATSL